MLGGMVAHAVLEGGHKVVPEDLQHNDLRKGGMRRQPVSAVGAVGVFRMENKIDNSYEMTV